MPSSVLTTRESRSAEARTVGGKCSPANKFSPFCGLTRERFNHKIDFYDTHSYIFLGGAPGRPSLAGCTDRSKMEWFANGPKKEQQHG